MKKLISVLLLSVSFNLFAANTPSQSSTTSNINNDQIFQEWVNIKYKELNGDLNALSETLNDATSGRSDEYQKYYNARVNEIMQQQNQTQTSKKKSSNKSNKNQSKPQNTTS